MKDPYTKQDRDRLIWAAVSLAVDALLSLQPVREALKPVRDLANSLADDFGFAPVFPAEGREKP